MLYSFVGIPWYHVYIYIYYIIHMYKYIYNIIGMLFHVIIASFQLSFDDMKQALVFLQGESMLSDEELRCLERMTNGAMWPWNDKEYEPHTWNDNGI